MRLRRKLCDLALTAAALGLLLALIACRPASQVTSEPLPDPTLTSEVEPPTDVGPDPPPAAGVELQTRAEIESETVQSVVFSLDSSLVAAGPQGSVLAAWHLATQTMMRAPREMLCETELLPSGGVLVLWGMSEVSCLYLPALLTSIPRATAPFPENQIGVIWTHFRA